MKAYPEPIDLRKVKVFPLASRDSLNRIEKLIVSPDLPAPSLPSELSAELQACVTAVKAARERNASVMLLYGAHLIKNGALALVISLMEKGWVTHVATNGAGTIHDWELSHLGRTEESVRKNVATGTFGTWDETGRNIQLALMAGALQGQGYGQSLGRFIMGDGTTLPSQSELEDLLCKEPGHPLAAARADLLQAIIVHKLATGRIEVRHPWKETSIVAQAARLNVPLSVHPGIGYDIFTNHPMFNGAVVGRAAEMDFRLFGSAVEGLDGGVVLSVGSAIMGPQVFEKSLSCINNLRLQQKRKIVQDHQIFVVDIQDGGNWDWSGGEPPKSNPAYYLRFCKSFARMGGKMSYLQCDNVAFLHNLLQQLK